MANDRLIDEKSAEHINEQFGERLKRDVDITLYVGQENEAAVEFTRRFLGELVELNGRIKLSEKSLDDEAREAGLSSPSLVIGKELGYSIEFLGAPSGIEAGTLVETLAMVSSGEQLLTGAGMELLENLDRDVTLHSFVTPTCPHCPGSVLLNHRIAMAAPGRVRSVAVSAVENMDLAREHKVGSVPQQMINLDAASVSVGVQPENDFIEQVLSYGASNYDELMAGKANACGLPEGYQDGFSFG